MMGLLVKDLCLLKEQRQTAILLVMWLLMMVFDAFFFGDPSFMLGFLSFLGAIIAISTIVTMNMTTGIRFCLRCRSDAARTQQRNMCFRSF